MRRNLPPGRSGIQPAQGDSTGLFVCGQWGVCVDFRTVWWEGWSWLVPRTVGTGARGGSCLSADRGGYVRRKGVGVCLCTAGCRERSGAFWSPDSRQAFLEIIVETPAVRPFYDGSDDVDALTRYPRADVHSRFDAALGVVCGG
jgi:hypothetical protein